MARQVGIFYWRTYFDVGVNDTYTNVNSLLRNNSIGVKKYLKKENIKFQVKRACHLYFTAILNEMAETLT